MPSAGPSRGRGRKKGKNKSADKGAGARPPGGRRPVGLAPWCQSRMEEGGLVPPHSVLAPGAALGLLRSRALPSAQVSGIVAATRRPSNRTKQRGVMRERASARLFDRSCPRATRDPSRWGQLGSDRGCGGRGQQHVGSGRNIMAPKVKFIVRRTGEQRQSYDANGKRDPTREELNRIGI